MADSSQINLSWTSNDTAQNGFNIYRSTNGTNYVEIGTAGAGTTSCADTGLSASTTYYYKVNAFDSVGASANSNTASAATSAAGTSFAQLNGASGVIPGVGQTIGWSTNLGAPATVHVYVNNADGSITADEQARIQDAVKAFNDETGGDG